MLKLILILTFTEFFVFPSSFGNKEIYYITENSQCDNDENYKINCEINYSKTSKNKYIKVTIEILNSDSYSNLDEILEYELNLYDDNKPLVYNKSNLSLFAKNNIRYYFKFENTDNEKIPLFSKEDTKTNIPEVNKILKEKNIKSIIVEEYYELKYIPQKLKLSFKSKGKEFICEEYKIKKKHKGIIAPKYLNIIAYIFYLPYIYLKYIML